MVFLVDVVIECVKKWQSIARLDCHGNPLEEVHRLILVLYSRSYYYYYFYFFAHQHKALGLKIVKLDIF